VCVPPSLTLIRIEGAIVIERIRVNDAKPLPRVRVPRVRVPHRRITIDEALADEKLLGAALGDPASWQTWTSVLRATFGLPLSAQDHERFQAVAGQREPPTQRVSELWAVLGRRSGKTRIAAAISVFIGTLEEHKLAPGEIGFVLLLASSKSQAQVAFQYVIGFLEQSPILSQLIEGITADEVRLKGNIIIGVHTNNFRTLRGRTLLAVIGDETSFWRDDSSASPDVETFRACVPALAAAGGIWVGISTGYRKMGLLYQKWRDHFGQSSDDVLVVQGATENFNPILNRAVIDKAKAADPEASESEWMGGWRDDIAAFLDDALVDAAIDPARPQELPPRRDLNYVAFCDASGGRKDAFTLCIGHREGERYIADVVRGKRAPFDPNAVVAEYAALLKEYRVRKLSGDNYSAAWVEMAWKAEGLIYERSELAKSGIYLESLPLFVRQVVAIPEQSTLTRELRLLERRTSRAGKDIVDHGRTGSDDYANSLCGLLYLLTKKKKYRYDTSMKWVDGGKSEEETNAAWRRDRLFGHMTYGGNRRLF
jgi:hypothetical protein